MRHEQTFNYYASDEVQIDVEMTFNIEKNDPLMLNQEKFDIEFISLETDSVLKKVIENDEDFINQCIEELNIN